MSLSFHRSFSYFCRLSLLSSFGLFLHCADQAQQTTQIPPPVDANLFSPTETLDAEVLSVKDSPNPYFVNSYAALMSDVDAGTTQLVVKNDDWFKPGKSSLQPKDLLMIIQMQGATIRKPDSKTDASYGEIVDIKQAGNFEFVSVKAIDPESRTITVSSSGAGLKHSYRVAGHTQLLRVPMFGDLIVPSTAKISAPPWNGETGGIIAFRARNLVLEGTIEASRIGFRGAAPSASQITDTSKDEDIFYSDSKDQGARKGEGIAGGPPECAIRLDCFGRGAVANGGGGGNSVHAGGGGGGNGSRHNIPVHPWQGRGVMNPGDGINYLWQKPWTREEGILTPAMLTNEPGGGRGGYTLSINDQDPKMLSPGDMGWGGNLRRNRGGLGGRPVPNHLIADMDAPRLFLGGGGGGGNTTDDGISIPAAGGNGGGIVFISAENIQGHGSILADGANGSRDAEMGPGAGGGGGGGGAGGTIVLETISLKDIAAFARGGDGGNHALFGKSPSGPGGGGGGGHLSALYLQKNGFRFNLSGGEAGSQGGTSSIAANFAPNGATDGFPSAALGMPAPTGTIETLIERGKISFAANIQPNSKPEPGGEVSFQLVVTNPDSVLFHTFKITGSASLLTNVSFDCVGQGLSSCDVPSGIGHPALHINLAPGAQVVVRVKGTIPETAACQPLEYTAVLEDPVMQQVISQRIPFQVYQPVTLQISESSNPADGAAVQESYILVQRNKPGCTPQGELAVQITLPEASVFQSVHGGDAWDCKQEKTLITCKQIGNGILSRIRVSFLPPSNASSMDLKAEVFAPYSTLPLDTVTKSTPIWNITKDGLAGGGISCALTPSSSEKNNPVGVFFLLLVSLIFATSLSRAVRNRLISG